MKRGPYMTIRRKNELMVKKNNWAKWKLLVAVSVIAVNVVYFLPPALEVINPTNIHFGQAIVHAKEIEVPETVEQTIRRLAKEANFQWPDYLVRLANCESYLNPFETNAKGNVPVGSVDRGVFGINDYWHKEVSDEVAFNLEAATKWTMDWINKGHQNEWMCDPLVRANPAKYNTYEMVN